MLARPSKFLPLQKGALPPSNTVIKYFNITDILIFIITQTRAWKLVKQHYVYRQATLHVEILRLQNFPGICPADCFYLDRYNSLQLHNYLCFYI